MWPCFGTIVIIQNWRQKFCMTLRHLRIQKRLYRLFFFTTAGGKQMINGQIYVPEFTLSLWCENYTRDAFPLKYSWKIYLYFLFILKSIIAIKIHQVANHGFNTHVSLTGTHWIKKTRWGKRAKDNWKEKQAQEQASYPASCKATCTAAVPSFSATSLSTLEPSAVTPTGDSSISCSEPSYSWMDQSHMLLSPIAHQTIYSATCSITSVKQARYKYIMIWFFQPFSKQWKTFYNYFFLISLLISFLPLTPFLGKKKKKSPNMTWDSQ